jgi:serine/threonine protein phosphatase 1
LKIPLARIEETLTRAAQWSRDALDWCVREARVGWGAAKAHALDAKARLLAKFQPPPVEIPLPPRPPAKAPEGRRVYAVGDIHGRADLLRQLLDSIQKDALGGSYVGKPVLIFLGDYVDRGMQSKQVIDVLLSKAMSPFETHFLKGNHESAMLDFLSDPGVGPRWAEYGGAETLASYGVRPPRSRTSVDEWAAASEELKRVLPPDHLNFLRNLQLSLLLGDYLFVHAGVRPGVEIDHQSERDMLWIRDDFLNDARPLDVVVVHGHTPAPRPYRDHRRIGLDTGAYLSGKLTAARFEHESVDFLSTAAGAKAAPVVHS